MEIWKCCYLRHLNILKYAFSLTRVFFLLVQFIVHLTSTQLHWYWLAIKRYVCVYTTSTPSDVFEIPCGFQWNWHFLFEFHITVLDPTTLPCNVQCLPILSCSPMPALDGWRNHTSKPRQNEIHISGHFSISPRLIKSVPCGRTHSRNYN